MSARGPDAATAPARWRWQPSSRDLLLVVVAAALLLSGEVNRRRSADLTARIKRLRQVGRELDVVDPRRLAAIGRPSDWVDDHQFQVFVPADGDFRVCLATRAINADGLPVPQGVAPLGPGKHTLTLTTTRHDGGTRCVVLDGKERRLAVEEPAGWAGSDARSSRSAARIGKAVQAPADRPLVLLRSRYRLRPPGARGRHLAPSRPVDGVMLWVERVADGRPGCDHP